MSMMQTPTSFHSFAVLHHHDCNTTSFNTLLLGLLGGMCYYYYYFFAGSLAYIGYRIPLQGRLKRLDSLSVNSTC